MKILIIEDEFKLADTISDILKDENFKVKIESDGIKGEEEALTNIYDLIILDVMLPHKDGFAILETLKAKISTPIIILTAKSEISDKLKGLENGAVDYITKPFHTRELIARVKIALRRQKNVDSITNIEYGDLNLNVENSTMCCNNKEIQLSIKEFDLIESLITGNHAIIEREFLAEKVWGYNSNAEYNNVEVYISFLRRKLKRINSKVQIKYIKGKGYKLEASNDK